MEDIKTYFKVFTVEKMERRIAYKLFGHTIFRSGVKRRGLYDMFTILEKYTGVKTKFKKIGLQHGWAPQNYFAKEELEEKVLFYLHWNKRRKNIWDKNSNIPSSSVFLLKITLIFLKLTIKLPLIALYQIGFSFLFGPSYKYIGKEKENSKVPSSLIDIFGS